jgi:hypothetical protein
MATNTIATNAITIFIADDHPVTRMGLRDMLVPGLHCHTR